MKEIPKTEAVFKQSAEDFIVEEVQESWSPKISPEDKFDQVPDLSSLEPNENRSFLACELEKKNIDLFSALRIITKHLHKGLPSIGYAGIKDKKAHTVQRITIFEPDMELVKTFKHPNIYLKNLRWEKRKIKMGYLDGNRFAVTLREIDKKDAIKLSSHLRKLTNFPNYFGKQRFGAVKGNNAQIGRLLVKKKFAEAFKEITDDNAKRTDEEALELVKRLERKQTLMYVHALQSHLFNQILERALSENFDFTKKGQQKIPLMGYRTRIEDEPLREIEEEVLAQEGIELSEFNLMEIPHLRIKGDLRDAVVPIEDLELEILEEENPETKTMKLKFTLKKGTYATTFLENFFVLRE